MDIERLKSLIAGGESNTLEFKKSTSQLKMACQTLCAFLNGKNGTVLIGVTDNGQILGQEVADNTLLEIAHELGKIEPPAHIEVYYVTVGQNKQVIVIDASSDGYAPYVYDGRPYWREQSSTKRMPQQRYDQLLSRRFKHNFSWEELEAKDYTVSDLDHDLILGVARKAVEEKRMPETALRQELSQLLEALQLSSNDKINNAAVALFGKKITSSYLQCQLKIARFKGLDRKEFLDSDIVYGNAFELLDKGMLFIKRHLPVAARIESGKLERIETPIIPFDAIREALINALCHRDYAERGGSIGLAIYEDRMEIFNNGGLSPGVTLEKIKSGYSKPRNPIIADVFYRCKLIERWGRGIPEIIGSCIKMHDPEPEFITDEVEFKIIFKFPTTIKPHVLFLKEQQAKIAELTGRQREILEILSTDNALSVLEIFARLQKQPSLRMVKADLAVLKRMGLVEQQGKARKAAWSLPI